MKSHFYSTYKTASQIVLYVLIVFSLSFTSLSYKQEVVVAQEDSYTFVRWIISLQEQNKLDEALAATDEFIRTYNTREAFSWGYNMKGNIFSQMGEYTNAIYAYQESLQYSQQEEKIYMLGNIGHLQHALGDYTDAISYYEQAIHLLNTDDFRRYPFKMQVEWSRFYLSEGDTAILNQVYLEASPKLHKIENHLIPFNKGMAYGRASEIAFQLGRFNDAIQLNKTFVNIKNTNSAKLDLATKLLYLKNEVEANEVFRRVDLRNVDNGSLALWYWLKGDEIQAKVNLERYLVEGFSSEAARENARRNIRKDEILPYDMWKGARKQEWFRELVYSNTIDYQDEKYSEQPKEGLQGQRNTFPNINQDGNLEDSSTTVFSTKFSNVFHKPDCSKLNKSEGLIEFASSQQASRAGGLPCNYCKP